ncbi:MAG: hypothetical protein M1838_003483 [Thelocarpon superellum]|nr:MAG: hypothetical protein M1838_003483 [Thelocarpon superellum]
MRRRGYPQVRSAANDGSFSVVRPVAQRATSSSFNPPTSIATAPAPTGTGLDDSSLFRGGTSTFQGVGTSALVGLTTASSPPNITPSTSLLPSATPTSISSTTAAPTASESKGSSDNNSSKITPYIIAGASVGGLIVATIVIWLVIRCVKRSRRAQRTRDEMPAPPAKRVQSGDWNDSMTFASGSKSKEDQLHFFDSSVASVRTESPQGEPWAPPPLKLAPSSFIGRERGDLVRATISRHPLATLDEHAFFCEPDRYEERAAATAPQARKASLRQPGMTQQMPFGTSGDGSRQVSTDESSLSSGPGDMTAPPPAANPFTNLLPNRPRRSRIPSSWKLSRLSSNPSNAPRTPAPSVRESVATSVGTSVESVARFRSVHGWVDYQSSRADRQSEYPDDLETFTFFDDGNVSRVASSNGSGKGPGRESLSTVSTLRPFDFPAPPEPQAYGFPTPDNDDARKTWITEREARSVYGDLFSSDYNANASLPPSNVQSRQPSRRTPPNRHDSSRTDTMYKFYTEEDDYMTEYGREAPERSWVEPPVPPLSRPAGSRTRHNLPNDRGGDPNNVHRMDSTSTATVFRYHPGEEVPLARHSRVSSVELDQSLGH